MRIRSKKIEKQFLGRSGSRLACFRASSEVCNRKAERHPEQNTSRGRQARPRQPNDRNPKQTSNCQHGAYPLHDDFALYSTTVSSHI